MLAAQSSTRAEFKRLTGGTVPLGSELVANMLAVEWSKRMQIRGDLPPPEAVTLASDIDANLLGIFLFLIETYLVTGTTLPASVLVSECGPGFLSRAWGSTTTQGLFESVGLSISGSEFDAYEKANFFTKFFKRKAVVRALSQRQRILFTSMVSLADLLFSRRPSHLNLDGCDRWMIEPRVIVELTIIEKAWACVPYTSLSDYLGELIRQCKKYPAR